MKEKSYMLAIFSIITMVCGIITIGLAAWNAEEVAWSPITHAIAIIGGILMAVSILGLLNSQGCTFCCYTGLYLYLILMGIITLLSTAFVITAGIKKSEWITEMAKKYSDDDSQENIDNLKEAYDEFWPYIIGFGCVTIFSCIGGFLAARAYKYRLANVNRNLNRIMGREALEDKNRIAKRNQVKKDHHNLLMQMTEKYGKNKY